MTDMEKFNKHCNKSITVKLKNKEGEEDEFEFKPLNVLQFSTMMVVGDNINKSTDKKESVNPADAKELMTLYADIVHTSYPELPLDIVDNFVVTNFESFGNIIEKLIPNDVDKKKVDTLKRIKEMQLKKPEKVIEG